MRLMIVSAFALFLVGSCASTDDSAGEATFAMTGGEAPTPEEMAQMMAMFEEAAKPGEQHHLLRSLVGKWNTVSTSAGMPGVPPETSAGTIDYRLALGGRQIVGDTTSTMMGRPFQGLMILGYDNVAKEYVSVWSDNWSTGIFMTRGTADSTGKIVTLKGEIRDAMSPVVPRPWKLVIKLESDHRHVIDVYDTVAPGQEPALVVSVVATRAS